MTKPNPEQVAQWAREEATAMGSMSMFATLQHWRDEHQHRLVTRAMAEQAEADAVICQELKQRIWVYHDQDVKFAAENTCDNIAAAIRANAPKVTKNA